MLGLADPNHLGLSVWIGIRTQGTFGKTVTGGEAAWRRYGSLDLVEPRSLVLDGENGAEEALSVLVTRIDE